MLGGQNKNRTVRTMILIGLMFSTFPTKFGFFAVTPVKIRMT